MTHAKSHNCHVANNSLLIANMIDGLILADLNTQPNIDVAIDGADECDSQLNLVTSIMLR
jgi:ribose 5-phosphate isomerase